MKYKFQILVFFILADGLLHLHLYLLQSEEILKMSYTSTFLSEHQLLGDHITDTSLYKTITI